MAEDFQALQQDILNTQNSLFAFLRQSEQVKAQASSTMGLIRHREVTIKALGEVADTDMYQTVGKSYVLQPKDRLVKGMAQEIAKGQGELKVLKNTHDYIDSKQKEVEGKLAELLKQLASFK